MKKLVVLGLVALVSSVCCAQEYAGFTLGRSFVGGACPAGGDCGSGSVSSKLVVGAPLNGRLYAAGISAYELAYMRFGRSSQKYSAPLPNQLQDDLDAGTPVYGNYERQRNATALAGAFVARYAVLPETRLAVRAGLAYVSSSRTTLINGARSGLITASHLRPYLGLGIEQQVLSGTRVTAGLDWTQYEAGGNKSSLTLLGLSVLQDF
jgi:hypothetical protein